MPAVSVPLEQAPGHFGWLAMVLGADIPASSALTRQLLGSVASQSAPGLPAAVSK